jgi:hypothetical protein
MAIPTSGSVAADVPPGTQTTFRIVDASFDENNRYGPKFELDLELTDDAYLGTMMKYWAALQQPRLNKVRKLRESGLDDETISEVLKKQNFKFDKIDEADTLTVSRFGQLYAIIAAVEGSIKGAEAALNKYNSFSELAASLIDGSFVGTTRLSGDAKYCQLDGREEIFPVSSPVLKERKQAVQDAEDEFDDLAAPDFG